MNRLRIDTGRPFRFPFDIDRRIFLALAVFFFVLAIKPVNKLLFTRITTSEISHNLQKSYKADVQDFEKAVSKLSQNEISSCTFSADRLKALSTKNWTLTIYKYDRLCAWSRATNQNVLFDVTPNIPTPYFTENEVGLLIKKNIAGQGDAVCLVGKFPLYLDYNIENTFFNSQFIFSQNLDATPEDFGYRLEPLDTERQKDIEKIVTINGVPTFQLSEKDNFLDVTDRNFWRYFFVAVPFILFGVSFHTFLKVSVKRNPPLYFSILIASVLLIRFFTFYFAFPDDYSGFYLFNPSLYAGHGINFTLGDVFINACLLFWIFFFYIMNVQNKVVRFTLGWHRYLFLFFFSLIFLLLAYHLLCNMRSIIYDSTLNFEVTLWNSVSAFTMIGLGTLLLTFMNFVFSAIILFRYFEKYADSKWVIFLVPIVGAILTFFFVPANLKVSVLGVLAWASLFFYLIGLRYLNTKFDFNSYKLIYWLIFLSASCVLTIFHFDNKKEIATRLNIAQNILQFEDNNIENKLSDLNKRLASDPFFLSDSVADENITEYINRLYLFPFTRQYSTSITLHPIDYEHSHKSVGTNFEHVLTNSLAQDSSYNLYLINNPGMEEYVLSTIVGERQLVIRLKPTYFNLKNESNILATSQFDPTSHDDFSKYKLAFYANDELVNQIGIGRFPEKLRDNLKKVEGLIFQNNNYSDVIHHIRTSNIKKSIIIRQETNVVYNFSTTYAYIFSIIFGLVSLYILGNIIARSNLRRKRFVNLLGLTLRMRIQLSILFVELISLTIIGFVTIYMFTNKARSSAIELSNIASREIQYAIRDDGIFENLANADSSNFATNGFMKIIKPYLDKHKVDLIIYSTNGTRLFTTVAPPVASLIPNHINPMANYDLIKNQNGIILKTQKLGELEYYTTYSYLRNSANKKIGIMETPNFTAQQVMQQSNADVITMLINIYAFVFLLSSLFSFYITKRLTKSFKKIVTQFAKINLTQTNEPLTWPYSDEIGLLIKEYNRTLRKLENSTVLLAKSERELAWREMAKQIAHEIKNPLTPMSLSLQSLQMAIRRNDPNVPEITERMTNTVLEQIKVLTRIASNFSEFARMIDIEARKESLIDILESTTGIYSDTEETEYLFVLPKQDIYLYVDKVKIIRVITNVIQNAVQSIPADRTGKITLIVTREVHNKVKITVADNGDGIPDEFVAKVFEPNFTTKFLGSGLGLAMCKDIMLKSGGNIYFETELGKGTDFHIEIPEYHKDDEQEYNEDDDYEDEDDEDYEDDLD